MGYAMRRPDIELRRNTRFATAFKATLQVDGTLTSVIIGDISADGALIRSKLLPAIGARVRLVAKSLFVRGRIMWRREGLAGVSFDNSVDPLHVVRENIDYFDEYRKRRANRLGETGRSFGTLAHQEPRR